MVGLFEPCDRVDDHGVLKKRQPLHRHEPSPAVDASDQSGNHQIAAGATIRDDIDQLADGVSVGIDQGSVQQLG